MADKDNDWIAQRAYALWEEQDRPDGRRDEHWQQADEEWRRLTETARLTREKSEMRITDAKATELREASNIDALPDAKPAASTPPRRPEKDNR